MTITEVQQETGWGKRGDQWVPPASASHGHESREIDSTGTWDPGDLKWSARALAATGWLLADGSAVSRQTYKRLYEALGGSASPWGQGDGSTTFNVPNVKGRVVVMRDPAQTEFDTLGETGGSKTSTAAHTHSLSDHRHGLEAHTHPFGTNVVSTNHAHNVYARNQDTGWMHANWNHWHTAHIGNMHWNGTQTHGHHDRANVASEAPWEGANWAGTVPVNVDGRDTNHVHNFNHDHPSTNYNNESPWAGNWEHSHSGTTGGWNNPGGTAAPSTNTSGASSAEATSGNLQPYTVLNCFVKT